MGYKLTHIISGNVRSGNWDMIATAPDANGNAWRHNDQRIAAHNAEVKRKAERAKNRHENLERFRAALDKLHKNS